MSGYFDLLEAELRTATERTAGARRQRGRRLRARADGVALASAIAVALLVALLAVALLGHAHRASSRPAASKPAPQTDLHRLVDEFGVLRRRQTPADRPPKEWQATLVPSGAQHGGSASFDPGRGFASFPSALGMRRSARTRAWIPTWVSVVPDGVRSVRWTFFASRHGRYERQLTLTVSVVGNIASASVAGTGMTEFVEVVWRNGGGRTIRAYLHAGVPPAGPAIQVPSTFRKLVLNVLRPDGIGSVRFGASPAAVRAAIDSLTRQQGGSYTVGGSCGIDHAIKWWDQWTGSGEPALTVFFHRSAFAGYQFGDPPGAGVLRSPPGGWQLATTRGLRIGDTLARGRQLYGRAFAISAAQGGAWSVGAPRLIKGYSWGTPDHMPLSSQRVVATIDAGDVGCPAVSP
jgi:hypothetical protein